VSIAGLALAGVMLAVAGCEPGAGAHERKGDRAYSESRFADAVAAYRLAVRVGTRADLWAKVGSAGLRLPDYAIAAEAYRELAASDALRVMEATQGLDLAAQGAERADDFATLRVVLLSLLSIAPDWANGTYALKVVRHVETTPEERMVLLLLAVAAAPDRRIADSLLGAYADVLRHTGSCRKGIRVYRSVLRRTESSRLAEELVGGRAACALELGWERLGEEPWAAEGWFLEAVETTPDTDIGRMALVGLGQARAAQGDLIGAALAYQDAVTSTANPDSITILAMEKLNEIASAQSPGDTLEPAP
jgi:tetratricopeptide (TPR) repeat protein